MQDSHGNTIHEGDRVRVTCHGAGVPKHLAQGTHKVQGFTRTKVVLVSTNFTGTYKVPASYIKIV